MKKFNFKKSILVLSVIFLAGFATYAVAGRGYGFHMGGYGNHMMGYGGYHMGGGGHMMGYGNGYHMGYGRGHMWYGLSKEDRGKMIDSMDKFYKKSKDVREKLYQKNLDLRKELSKKNSSKSKALKLQKDISVLEAKFDKFRLEHMLEMQKKFPERFRGYNR